MVPRLPRTGTFLSRFSIFLLAILLIMGLGGVNATPAAAAPTNVSITVDSDAYAVDNAGQITSDNEFLYDSSKGETATDAYQIAYRGTLDMKGVWNSYNAFKLGWLFRNGFDKTRYAGKTFSGEWDISFTVDPTVVSANPDFVSCATVQAEMEKQNAPSKFGDIMRCETAAYDAGTGKFTAHFKLQHADGSKVTGGDLEKSEYQPAKLVLTTPKNALYVPQSKFVAGKTFKMVDPTVSGKMAMDYFYVGMPLLFKDTADPVALTMVATNDAKFTFASRDSSRQLPEDILKLTPAAVTMLRTGDKVSAPELAQTSIKEDQGTWNFEGWTPAEATVDGKDLNFIGYWSYTMNSAPSQPAPTPKPVAQKLPNTGSYTAALILLAGVLVFFGVGGIYKRRRNN